MNLLFSKKIQKRITKRGYFRYISGLFLNSFKSNRPCKLNELFEGENVYQKTVCLALYFITICVNDSFDIFSKILME